MKRTFLSLLILVTALTALATPYNGKQQKMLPEVRVAESVADTTVTTTNKAASARAMVESGVSYYDGDDFPKAEECFLKALETYTQLFKQNPDTYREDLAGVQDKLGNIYFDLHDDAKSEEFYLKALENKIYLFNKDPEAYRASVAETQVNLGTLYADTENYAKAEECFLEALEN